MGNLVKEGIKGTAYVYAELILSKIIAFFIPIILVNNLTKSDYGAYTLIPSILLVVAYITSFGLEDVFVRYIPEYIAKKSFRRINSLFFSGMFIRFISLAIVLAVLFLYKTEIMLLLNAPPIFTNIFLFILLFIGIDRMTYLGGNSFMIGCYKRHYVAVLRLAKDSLKLLLFIIIVYVLDGGLYLLLLAMVISALAEFIIYFALASMRIYRNYKNDPSYLEGEDYSIDRSSKTEQKRIRKYGFFSMLSTSMNTFKELSLDYPVISYYLSTSAVADYSVASIFPSFIRNFAPARMSVGVVLPLLVKEYVGKDKAQVLRRAFSFLFNINMFVLFPMCAGTLILIDKAIYLIFPPSYAAVTNIVYILIPTLLVSSLADPYYIISNIIEKKEIIFISSILGAYNLIMDILLVPHYGIMGAAIATGSAGVLTYLYFWFVYKFILKMRIRVNHLSAAKMLLNTCIMSFPLVILYPLIDSIPLIILWVIIGAAAYFISSFLIKPFPSEESEFINKKLNKRWFIF